MVDSCVICCQDYNSSGRRPWDLGCGHCVCEQCYNTSKLAVCVECRQPVNNPHLQYTLLRMLQPSSPSSFPIGVADTEDEAPGTPHPTAPVMEVGPFDVDSDSDSRRASDAIRQHRCSTASLRNPALPPAVHTHHRLSQTTSHDALRSTGRGVIPPMSPSAPSAPLLVPPFHPLPILGRDISSSCGGSPDPARSTCWPANGHGSDIAPAGPEITAAMADNIVSHHSFLESFPVEDFDLLDWLPESSISSAGTDKLDGNSLDAAATAAEEDERPAVNKALLAVQGAVGSCTMLAQQLLVPHVLFEHSTRQGWPAPGPSLILAATSSSWRTWSAYSSAMQRTVVHCNQLQQLIARKLGQALQAVGLPNNGHLAAYLLATWLLGALLYHWSFGLQLLPVAAAALGLMSFGAMKSSSGGCSLWPAKLAGALVTGDCLLVGIIGLMTQQTGVGLAVHSRLLAATPQLLLVALLLTWGQVVVEVLGMGWADYRELKFASLVARCWFVAAAAVLLNGTAGAAAMMFAAMPWVQKCHLLVETPVIMHHLALLLQSSSTCWNPHACSAPVGAASAGASCSRASRDTAGSMRRFDSVRTEIADSEATVSTAANASSGAWLLCMHIMLQLSLLLFVPPAPLAAAGWLLLPVCNMLMWASRVLLCGCVMQLVLNAVPGSASTHPGQQSGTSGTTSMYSGPACSSSNCLGRRNDSQGRPKLGLCGVEVDVCRISSSCSSPAQDCMALAARSRSPACDRSASRRQPLSSTASHDAHSLWGLACTAAMPYSLSATDRAGRPGVMAGVAGLLRQHAVYLVLLFFAAAGDSFIMAVPSAGGAVRAAWHACVQQMLVVAFIVEFVLAVWHECVMLRYQHYVAAAGLVEQEAGRLRARTRCAA